VLWLHLHVKVNDFAAMVISFGYKMFIMYMYLLFIMYLLLHSKHLLLINKTVIPPPLIHCCFFSMSYGKRDIRNHKFEELWEGLFIELGKQSVHMTPIKENGIYTE